MIEKIKKYRKQLRLSQKQVAKEAGISQAAYAKIENGTTKNFSIDVGKGISKALGISFNELFEIELPSNIEEIQEEIKRIKDENASLKEQLSDKKMIIEFLSSNDMLVEVAAAIYRKENPKRIRKRDFNDLDGFIKEIEDRPYDPENKESLINYIRPRLEKIQLK